MHSRVKLVSQCAKHLAGACLLVAGSIAFASEAPHSAVPVKSGPTPWSPMELIESAPRQHARVVQGLGQISFPISTRVAEAQQFFNQGVAELHGFAYMEAERSFRQAAELSPKSAMPYWGMAVANRRSPARATAFLKQALLLKSEATPREQRWIDAYAQLYIGTIKSDAERRQGLIAALESLCLDDPTDVEARAFLLLQLWDNQENGLPRPSRIIVEELGRQALARQPLHPGVHQYLIRLWNQGEDPSRVTALAEALPNAAPAGAHHWHIAGKVFAATGRYDAAVQNLQASARATHAYMQVERLLPDEVNLYAENSRLLVESLANAGRVDEAVEFAKALMALPRSLPEGESVSQVGQESLLRLLTRFEMWSKVVENVELFTPQEDIRHETVRLRGLGVAAFSAGQLDLGKKLYRELQIVQMKLRARRVEAAESAESAARKAGVPEDQVAEAMAAAWMNSFPEMRIVETALAEIGVAQALQQGDIAAAARKLKEIQDLPPLREAQLRFAVGERTAALQLAEKAVEEEVGSMLPLANLADLQWRSGDQAAAVATLLKLRPLSGGFDLHAPVLARLSKVAAAAKLSENWRSINKLEMPKGPVASLVKTGDTLWKPYAAPAWSLTDGDGIKRSLADFRGRPVLVVFYLGSGCVHCIEQLNTFAPLTKEYADAGIAIVAVSTESAADLHKTWEQAKSGEGFPYPILADPTLTAFRAYGAYDDFESKALHGAFLVDGNGKVRWHNIGPAPFVEGEWLLKEAKRLLDTPVETRVTSVAPKAPIGRNDNTVRKALRQAIAASKKRRAYPGGNAFSNL